MPSSARCSEATPEELEERLRFFARQIKSFRKTGFLCFSPEQMQRIKQMEEDYEMAVRLLYCRPPSPTPSHKSSAAAAIERPTPRQVSSMLQSFPEGPVGGLPPRPGPEHLLFFLWGVLIELRPDTPQPDSRPDTPQPDSRPDTPQPDSRPDTPQPDSRPDTPQPDSRPDTPQPDSRPDTPQPDSRPDTPQPDPRPDTHSLTPRPDTPQPDSRGPDTPQPDSTPTVARSRKTRLGPQKPSGSRPAPACSSTGALRDASANATEGRDASPSH
ncbi:hypothetical protein CRENBAI_013078 [Crenichthys baileyi]|uniref:Uncharacterized protein n=1 Tax=Crenichthys baileyi TaxID=28760 RepID=A0AAV9QV72_9TELE